MATHISSRWSETGARDGRHFINKSQNAKNSGGALPLNQLCSAGRGGGWATATMLPESVSGGTDPTVAANGLCRLQGRVRA